MSAYAWQKSSYSQEGANCVYVARVPADWQQSTYCGEGEGCVNVAASGPDLVALRESDDPGVIVTATPAQFQTFIRAVKAGEFDHLGR